MLTGKPNLVLTKLLPDWTEGDLQTKDWLLLCVDLAKQPGLQCKVAEAHLQIVAHARA